MMGLVKKEFFLLRKSLAIYALVLAVYAAISASGFWGVYAYSALAVLIPVSCPFTTMAYDQASRWDSYVNSLPGGGKKAVSARYGVILLVTAGCILLCIGIMLALSGVGLAAITLGELVASTLACAALGLLIAALSLPLCYRFGVERGRLLSMGVLLAACALLAGGLALRGSLGGASTPTLVGLSVAALGVVAAALLLSWRVSVAIYTGKEW